MELLHCIAFILVQDGQFLAEKRTLATRLDPGAIAIPGGHVEPGETWEQALHREAKEELGITLAETQFVCSLQQTLPEPYWIHYYAVSSWTGQIDCLAADALLWLSLNEPEKLDIEVDRLAVNAYRRAESATPYPPQPKSSP